MTPDISFDEHSARNYAIKINGRWVGPTDDEKTIKRIAEWLGVSWGELTVATLASANVKPVKKPRTKKAPKVSS